MSISLVQSNKVNPTGVSTSLAVTLPTGVIQGNMLVVTIGVGNNATTITAPDGSWHQTTINQPAGTNATIETAIYYLVVDAGHAGGTSWTWTISASHTIYICIAEWNSAFGWPATPNDVSANGDTAGTPATAVVIDSGTTATTGQAEELWIGALAYKNSAQTESNISAGWTVAQESTLAANNTQTMLYKVVNATGAANVNYTIGVAEYWAGCITTFKDVVGVSLSGTLAGVGTLTGTLSLVSAPLTGTLAGVGTLSGTLQTTAPVALSGTLTGVGALTGTLTTVPPPPTYTVMLAGQDITLHIDQMSIVIDDTLGQGSGAGSSGSTQGRAATLKMNTDLGPMSNAIGAGQTIPGGTPSLVRQGEVVVTDATGATIFGGFATKYTDTTTSVLGQSIQPFTALEAIDYSTSLQRTFVREAYAAVTDVFIIRNIVNKYVPWVKLDFFPTSGTYTFPTASYNNQTVEQVLQTVAGITGFLIYVDYHKFLRYVSPTSASSAPYNLSDNPDFTTTFPHAVEEYLIDDNSTINRVFFFGGSHFSNDFTQDLSTQADGSNTTFSLAYQPQVATDGTYTVKVASITQILGMVDGTGPANKLISDGGLAQVLLDRGNQALTFNTAPAGSPTVTTMKYRYSFPLTVVTTDEISHAFFGNPYLDGVINDSSVSDAATAIQRSRVLLSQQSFGLLSLKVVTYKPGVQAGMLIHITNAIRAIDATYLVQEVQIEPLGAGNFVYHIGLGAWNWNLIDFLIKLPTLSTFSDQTTVSAGSTSGGTSNILQILAHAQVHDVWSKKATVGPYYARSAVVGDGHDAFPGFATVNALYVPRPFSGTIHLL